MASFTCSPVRQSQRWATGMATVAFIGLGLHDWISRERRATSPAQVAANRRNAQRSTGPRTKQGKGASSRNASSHGGYAKVINPIRSGALAEDPADVEAFVEAIVTAKKSRDELELEIASQIANALLRHRRAGRLEAYGLAHCSRVSRHNVSDVDAARLLGDVLRGTTERTEARLRSLVHFIRAKKGAGTLQLARTVSEPSPEGEANEPGEPVRVTVDPDAEPELYFDSLLGHFWDDEAAALAWSDEISSECEKALEETRDEVARVQAEAGLAVLAKVSVIDARTFKDLERLERYYEHLQERDLVGDETEGEVK